MKSTIRIEVNFDNGQPFIRVNENTETDDVRDRLISFFRQRLGGESSWCKVEFPFSDTNSIWHIRPVTPEQLATEEFEIATRIADTRGFPVMDNSLGFIQFLKDNNIKYFPNGHSTSVLIHWTQLFDLGVRFAAYKAEHSK